MAQFLQVHPENPQPRLLKQAVQRWRGGSTNRFELRLGVPFGR
jgi:hypothetical protein